MAVLALGRKESDEPFNSEDIALLTSVAGQVATALENGRLYRQLQLKADELDRLRLFNENIVESLDDGLFVLDLDDRIVRWNPPLETMYGASSGETMGRPLDEVSDELLRHELCHVWQMRNRGPLMPLSYAVKGYWDNPYEREARWASTRCWSSCRASGWSPGVPSPRPTATGTSRGIRSCRA